MAKFNGGIFSKLKGKLAGVVFQQYEGMQVGKEYQPNVKNPNTDAQVQSRARFKATSQKIALFSEILLLAGAKVSSYSRMIRAALVQKIMAITDWDDEEKKAVIGDVDFVSAVNSLNFNPDMAAPVLAGDSISNATISVPTGNQFRYTIAALGTAGNVVGQNTVSGEGAAQPIQILAPLTSETPASYEVVAIAIRTNTGNGNPTYENLTNADTVMVVRGVSAGDVLVSHIAEIRY